MPAAAHADAPRRPTLLTIPALTDFTASPASQPAPTARTRTASTDYGAAAGFYMILFSILAALLFGVFIPA